MDIHIESLERATLDAVGPSEIDTLPGWLLPYDTSTVGRAISAVPLRHADLDPALVEEIEARYAKRGLKTQFRVADLSSLAGFHQGMLTYGYKPQQPTFTLVRTTNLWPQTSAERHVQICSKPTEEWASVYLSGDFDPVDGTHRIRALSRGECLVYATLSDSSGAIAAGTASFSRGWASFHGLRTVSRERGKGCARALIAALGQEAQKRNIDRSFLQVEQGNTPAMNLYKSLGFDVAWLYHYWRKET